MANPFNQNLSTQAAAERAQRSVFVGNIPYEATEENLKDIFQQVGPVISFRIVYDRETGKPKGYGFCEYQDLETAQSAMRNLNNTDFNGRPLRVGAAAGEQNKDENRTMQQALGQAIAESPYGDAVPPNEAPEAISKAVASLPPEQMFELMKQMKLCIQNNPTEARNMLLKNPQLAYALLQAQIVMKIVDPQVAVAMLHRERDQIPPATLDEPKSGPPRPGPSVSPPKMMPPGGPQGQPMMQPGPGGPPMGMMGPPRSMGGPPGGMGGPQPMVGPPGPVIGGMPGNVPFGPGGPGGPPMGMPFQGGPGPQRMGGPTDPRDPRQMPTDPRNMMRPGMPYGGPGPHPGGPMDNLNIPNIPTSNAAANLLSNLPGGGASNPDGEKAALIMQVLNLSDAQINMLPPDQRQSILILKEQIQRSSGP